MKKLPEMDSFEKLAASQKLAEIPSHWKESILRNARAAVPKERETTLFRETVLNLKWGWAALLPVWAVILIMNYSSNTPNSHEPTLETDGITMAEMRRDLDQLLVSDVTVRPDAYLRPRSGRNGSCEVVV